MPNLHELFDAASDGLPPLPDLAPTARRIVRRRKLATRSAGAALSSALVIGAGTILIGGVHSSNPASGDGFGAGSSSTTRAIPLAKTFHQEAVSALQRIWPVAGEQIKFVGKPDQTVYAATTPTASYRVVLTFHSLPAKVAEGQALAPCATDTGPQSTFACSQLPTGQTVAARVGENMAEFDFTVGDVQSMLTVTGGPVAHIDARKLLTMAKSAIFQQLFADAHLYFGVITPMPGVDFGSTAPNATPSSTPSPADGLINVNMLPLSSALGFPPPDTASPTPPGSGSIGSAAAGTVPATSVTTPRGSDSAQPQATR
ncbi:hypothetical protein [Actinocrinis sp.]|uniref:hypothetical protein n=1 Tax=Actinocrinis sp. TaxID=1920516 RepID=UPI002D358D32|nr:hypothetical protein [Actinocrinis sp.]HZP54576.1 hypothetical protein [Actinocrinis sp.]